MVDRKYNEQEWACFERKIPCRNKFIQSNLNTSILDKNLNDKGTFLVSVFKGDLRLKVLNKIYKKIVSENLTNIDFDKEEISNDILRALSLPPTREEIYASEIRNKKRTFERLEGKKGYIKVAGKLMCDILNISICTSKAELSEKFKVTTTFIKNIVDFLQKTIGLDLQDRFTEYNRCGIYNKIVYDHNFRDELKTFLGNLIEDLPLSHPEKNSLFNTSFYLFENAINIGLNPEDMGRNRNARNFSIILIYYGLLYNGIRLLNGEPLSRRILFKYLGKDFSIELEDVIRLKSFYHFMPKNFNIKYKQIFHPFIITYRDLQTLVISKGWALKSDERYFYFQYDSPSQRDTIVICDKGHEFHTNYYRISHGQNCPYCVGVAPISYRQIEELILEKGGELITSEIQFNKIKGNPSSRKIWIECENGHKWSSYWDSISNRNSWCPYCYDRRIVIGNLIHPIIEYLILSLLKHKNCSADFEQTVGKDRNTVIDLIINRDSFFIRNIEKSQDILNFPNHISKVLIDITTSKRPEIIYDKTHRQYQRYNRFLLIVLLFGYDPLYDYNLGDLQSIDNIDNIKLLTFDQLLSFFDLNLDIGNWRDVDEKELEFIKTTKNILKIAEDSISSEKDFHKLIEISMEYKNKLDYFR
ncbi:MAG: hypothetical protein EU529_16135 [Promethearchaeota archaeon]|nr:MAG: hypothetical protein EU529_16135 [Candidatus Lokiarchaeota archaeon]